jgi:serine/threonine-protein phosphatase 6 catalytic subunit
MTKYGSNNAWKYCTRVFDLLTVAALIDNKVLCVHGGLSPDINSLGKLRVTNSQKLTIHDKGTIKLIIYMSILDQIRALKRDQEIPHKGALCDIVWSDPEEVGKF